MQVSSISAQNNCANQNFKALVFHDNAKSIITKGNKIVSKKVNEMSGALKNSGMDLHVTPDTTGGVSFFWTEKGAKNSVIEMQFSPFSKLTINNEANSRLALNQISSQKAEEAYRLLTQPGKNTLQRLQSATDITIGLSK